MIRNLNSVLIKIHKKGFIHGDISPYNIIIPKKKPQVPILIDWEMMLKIGENNYVRGTPGYSSLALDEAKQNSKQKHTYKRRDDFESLFFVLLYWLNKKRNIWSQDSIKEKQQTLFREWDSFKKQLCEMSGADVQIIQKLHDNLYKDYDLESKEDAVEVFNLFKGI